MLVKGATGKNWPDCVICMWLLMAWNHIGARPSAIPMQTQILLSHHINQLHDILIILEALNKLCLREVRRLPNRNFLSWVHIHTVKTFYEMLTNCNFATYKLHKYERDCYEANKHFQLQKGKQKYIVFTSFHKGLLNRAKSMKDNNRSKKVFRSAANNLTIQKSCKISLASIKIASDLNKIIDSHNKFYRKHVWFYNQHWHNAGRV